MGNRFLLIQKIVVPMKRHFTILLLVAVTLLTACHSGLQKQQTVTLSDDSLYATFQNPGHEWRGKPFWSWNGRLNKDELIRQLHVFKEMGMGGAFMHSRVGLKTEYLGREWFDLTNAVADEAEKIGMEAYLYDEDRWPSGSAGGLVTKDSSLRINYVTLYTMPAEEFKWDNDSIISAFACKLDGVNYSELTQLTPKSNMAEFKGKTVLKFQHETAECSDGYNGYTYIDPMNRAATDRYIQLTHEQYKTQCGDRLGRNIQGIFTDEPHRGGLFTETEGKPKTAPWTPAIEKEYKKRFGGNLAADLPKLFLRENGERVNPVKWQYCELTQELFLENYAEPIYDWCTKNNMIYTGHVLHENSFSNQVTMQGSLMRYYEYMHHPGVDMLTEHDNSYWVVKQLSSVARQLGKKWLLSELYGCTGWQFNFASHKAVGDWQALFGINVRCHHLSWYTMEGEAKRDYPASIFYQSAWWKQYKYVEDYFSRLGVMLNQGAPVCDLLIVSPIESVWSQVCEKSFSWLVSTDPGIQEMETKYANLFNWLAGERIDFDYGDEEMMSRYVKVDKDADGTPLFRVGNATYRTVLVGNMETMRSSTLKTLEKFEKEGGKVIFAGEAPKYVDVVASPEPAKLAQRSVQVEYAQQPIVDAVKGLIRPVVQVTDAAGKNMPQIFGQVRKDGNRYYVVLMSMDRQTRYDSVTVRLPYAGAVTLWNCRTGEVFKQPTQSTDQNGSVVLTSFEPSEEKVYTISEKGPAFAKEPLMVTEKSHVTLPAVYDYTLNEPNVCVLDLATWQLDEQAVEPLTEILKIDRSLRNHFGLPYRGGEMLQPWFAERYDSKNYKKTLGVVRLSFPFNIATMPKDTVYLGVETPHRFTIFVNGCTISNESKGWMIDNSINKIAIPAKCLRQGANKIDLLANFSRDLDLEAIYLFGNFGVELKGIQRTLTTLPAKLKVGDIVSQGLPFYSGAVCYQLADLPKPADGERIMLRLNGFGGGCVELVNDYAHQICGWAPYELDLTDVAAKGDTAQLNVVLTRRNTFGPLHALPAIEGAYGPGNWITEGGSFTMAQYVLLPAGLTQQPELVVERVK